MPAEIEVIDVPETARAALAPVRSSILAALREPSSAAMLAAQLGLPRQKVNYHLRALEEAGLAVVHGERRWGGLTERLLVASAASYVISPAALGLAARDPAALPDRLSAAYLVAVAARAVSDVGALLRRRSEPPTLTIDTEVSFASAAARAAFADELARAVTTLAVKYHTQDGSPHRLAVLAYPSPEAR